MAFLYHPSCHAMPWSILLSLLLILQLHTTTIYFQREQRNNRTRPNVLLIVELLILFQFHETRKNGGAFGILYI